MIKLSVPNRFTGDVQFTAKIDCEQNAEKSLKQGLAVEWAAENNASLSDAYLRGAYLRNADLRDVYLRGAYLRNADLRGANLNGVYLRGVYLRNADLRGANLNGANLNNANLSGADLRGANLNGANLNNANLSGADLSETNLSGADLSETNLSGADLSNADFGGANNISDRIIDLGLRSDGIRFYLSRIDEGEWRIKADCLDFTVSKANEHWDKTRPAGDKLGDETRLMISHGLAIAAHRKWPENGVSVAKEEAG